MNTSTGVEGGTKRGQHATMQKVELHDSDELLKMQPP